MSVIHGTYLDQWSTIEKYGLKQGAKLIHELPNAGEIIPGMDSECDVFIYIDETFMDKLVTTRSHIHPKDFKMVLFVPQTS
jgi:RNA 2'-phosphotransferase, Tpt1 / KptA family